MTATDHPYLVYSTLEGETRERRSLRACDYTGATLTPDDLIPLPEGATLSMLPERLPVGLDAQGARHTISAERAGRWRRCLPIGYTRTHLPAYAETETSFPLPFFGYSAIAGWRGQLYAAAIQTDDPAHWLPTAFNRRKLERAVRERLEAEPENRVLAHHAHCALDYRLPHRQQSLPAALGGSCRGLCWLQRALRRLHLQAGGR